MTHPVTFLALGFLLPFSASLALAEPATAGFSSVGIRGGISETPHVYHSEAFTDWQTPWMLGSESAVNLKTYLSGSLGWMGDSDHDVVMGSLGPSVRLSYGTFPVSLVGGCSPTLLSSNHVLGRNLGCAFQFTSHIGVAYQITRHTEVGYRFQHMSNGGMSEHNPGINFHAVWLAWRF